MAEGRYRTFAPLQKLPADWPTAVADFLAPLSNLNLAPKNLVTVMAPVDTQPQLSLGVDGLWRFSEIEIDAAVPAGAAQTFDIVATTTANVFKPPSKEGEGESDETNYAFALHVVTHNTLPSGGGIAAAQKVGEVDWDGAKITGIRQLVGQLRATDPISPAMPITSVPAITASGIAGATAPVVRWSAPEGSNVLLELLQGAAAKFKLTAAGQMEWTGGGPILHAEGSSLVLTGKLSVSEAATLAGGGTSTTPAQDDNTTKIATTAFVLGQASNANPQMDGEISEPGVSTRWARADHQHPHDATKANLASPGFSGAPTSTNPPFADNSNRIATTKYVQEAQFAPLASPELTGTPIAPTPPAGNNTTRLATTAFVATSFAPLASPVFTGEPKGVTPAVFDQSSKLATTAFVYQNVAPAARERMFSGEPQEPNTNRPTLEGFTGAKQCGFVLLSIASEAAKVVKIKIGLLTVFEYTSTGAPVLATLPITEGRLWKVEGATAVHSTYIPF